MEVTLKELLQEFIRALTEQVTTWE